jgi:hypothetical protein
MIKHEKMKTQWGRIAPTFTDVKKNTSSIQATRKIRYNIITGLVQPHELARL